MGQPDHARKQFQTVGVFPLWIVIRKVHANIAFAKRAKNRIGDRVQQSVGIGMSIATAFTATCTPPSISGRPSTSLCVSLPMPIRNMLYLDFGLWSLVFDTLFLVLCSLYFVLCTLFFLPAIVRRAKHKVLSTKYKVQRPKLKDQRPKT